MKPRTLARYALKKIQDGTFTFDTEDRKAEATRQMKKIVSGRPTSINNPEDPIIELHIGVYIPNFDYPIVATDEHGNPIVWKEDGIYSVPGNGTHTVMGISLSGESYYMSYLESLAPFRDAVVKVDRYTDITRAAYALVCVMSHILNKTELSKEIGFAPLKVKYDVLLEEWNTHEDAKQYEKDQHRLYIKWLMEWISVHGRNPDTHMRVLRPAKKVKTPTP